MYHTHLQKIQIFFKMKKYSEKPGYNKSMGILDNLENAWDEEFQFEHQNLAVKIFSETCCNGCTCQTSKEHLPEAEFVMEEIDFDQ